jgi:Xaa-Pro aminopeptidase
MNLVTVDLSPRRDGYCGDCARSFFVEGGHATRAPRNAEFLAGAAFLQQLHAGMRLFVRPHTTFHELATWSAEQISAAGWENLDFRKNVGHSIAASRTDRLYIEMGNHACLGEVDFFTFEPHVRVAGRPWGFKHEDIFYFDTDGRLEEL